MEQQVGKLCAGVEPAGSSKSTLLNIFGLLGRPTNGTLALSGWDTVRLGDRNLTRLCGLRVGFETAMSDLVIAPSLASRHGVEPGAVYVTRPAEAQNGRRLRRRLAAQGRDDQSGQGRGG